MLDRRDLLKGGSAGGLGLALAAVGAVSVRAQDPTPAATATAADRLNIPGPEAQRLAARVGLWDLTETFWETPDAEPSVTTGLIAERVMMGSLLQEIIRPPEDTGHAEVKRTDLLSFNRLEGRWAYVSFDTRVPVGLMTAQSADAGTASEIGLVFASFALPGTGPTLSGQLLHMAQTIRFQSANRDVKDQYFTLADGSGRSWLAHRYAYVRRG